MKRISAIILAALFVVVVFSACGAGDPAGKYVLKSIDGKPVDEAFNEQMSEFGMSLEEYLDFLGIEKLENFMTIELKADGAAKFSVVGEDDEVGTWKQEGGKIIVTVDDEDQEFSFSGNELTATIDDQPVVLVKK